MAGNKGIAIGKDTKNKRQKPKKSEHKSNQIKTEEIDLLSNIVNNQDIDQLIDFLKLGKNGKSKNVFNLSSEFIENHEGGIELFLKTAIKLEPKKK